MRILWNLILRHQQKQAIGETAVHGNSAGGTDLAHTWNLLQPVDQVREENGFLCFRFLIRPPRPRQGNVHGHDFVYAEPRINFQHLHQTTPEQPGSDHQNKRDRHLCRHNHPANTLAALRTRLSSPTFAQGLADVPRCGSHRGEHSQSNRDRGRNEERKHQDGHIDRDGVQARQIVRSERD